MKARLLTFLALLILALASLTTCSDPIYATIESETKTITSTLSLTISIFDIAVVPFIAPATSTYYIAAGRVFQGQLLNNAITWDPLSSTSNTPYNPTGATCNNMVFYAGTLWGGFTTPGGYALIKSLASPYSFNGGTTIVDPAVANKQVISLQVAKGHLFVGATVDTSTYEIDYSATGAAWSASPLISGSPYPYTGVVSDGTNDWTSTNLGNLSAPNSVVYKSIDPPSTGSFAQVATPPFSGDVVNGMFADTSFIFAATKKNGVYLTTFGSSGAAWTQVAPDQQGSVTVPYLCVAGPLAANTYIVGSEGYGYYILNTSTNTMTRFADSTKLLYTASVSKITVDVAGGNVLIGTNGRGLWRDTIADVLGGNSNWINE